MLRAVLFDLDDTLVDQASAAAAAALAWAAGHGVTGPAVVPRWTQVSERHYARYQRRELTFSGQRRERVREFLERDLDDDAADRIFADYLVRYEAGWRVFDDAVPALRRARDANLVVAVLTNGDEEHQRFKLDKLGLTDEVDALLASSSLPVGKPDPRAFGAALERLSVTPDQALMVGDSLEKDIRGAQAVGLPVVLVDRAGSHPDADVPRVASLDALAFPGGGNGGTVVLK